MSKYLFFNFRSSVRDIKISRLRQTKTSVSQSTDRKNMSTYFCSILFTPHLWLLCHSLTRFVPFLLGQTLYLDTARYFVLGSCYVIEIGRRTLESKASAAFHSKSETHLGLKTVTSAWVHWQHCEKQRTRVRSHRNSALPSSLVQMIAKKIKTVAQPRTRRWWCWATGLKQVCHSVKNNNVVLKLSFSECTNCRLWRL